MSQRWKNITGMFKATKNGFQAVFLGCDPMKEGKRKTANRLT